MKFTNLISSKNSPTKLLEGDTNYDVKYYSGKMFFSSYLFTHK